jgi:hypothetical protein
MSTIVDRQIRNRLCHIPQCRPPILVHTSKYPLKGVALVGENNWSQLVYHKDPSQLIHQSQCYVKEYYVTF